MTNTVETVEDILKFEKEIIEEIFNFEGDDKQLDIVLEHFSNYISKMQTWNFHFDYFLKLIEHYSYVRSHHAKVTQGMYNCILKHFPDQEKKIKKIIYHCHREYPFLGFICDREHFSAKCQAEIIDKLMFSLKTDNISQFQTVMAQDHFHLYEQPYLADYVYYKHFFPFFKPSLIDIAAFFGSPNCFKFLIRNNPRFAQSEKITQMAVAGGNPEIIVILKQANCKFNKCMDTAVKFHRYDLTEYFFKVLRKPRVPLPSCLNSFNFKAFFYFLDTGSKINDKDDGGNTSLHIAASYHHMPLIQYLVKNECSIHLQNSYNSTPLFNACEEGSLDAVKFLAERGAAIKTFDKRETVLHVACKNNNLPLVEYLLQNGFDINVRNSDNRTPLHVACNEGHLQIVQFLVEKGADINVKDNLNETPLSLASYHKHHDVAMYLIRHGGLKSCTIG